MQGVRRAAERGKQTYAGSWAEHLWHRLDTVNFLDQATLLAATLLASTVPFLLITAALAGRSAVSGLTRRLGLSQQAAADVGHLVTSSGAASGTVTGLSWVFFILAGIAGATAVQRLYQRVFDLDPSGVSGKLHVLIWLALAVGWMLLDSAVGPGLRHAEPVLFWLVALVAFISFWWFTMWFLLAGRVSWRRLWPCAVATGALWAGMRLVFSVISSGMITGNEQKYGPIGVVFALMTLFIAIGVVIILGAALGLMWQERGLSFRPRSGDYGGPHNRQHRRGARPAATTPRPKKAPGRRHAGSLVVGHRSRRPRSRARVTAWLRDDAPSLR